MTRPSGILLAGGASRRFGRSKLLEPLDGEPLFHRPLRSLLATCDRIVAVVAPAAPDLPLPPGAERVTFVHDASAFEGPLAGAFAGLGQIPAGLAFILAGDMPGVTPELLGIMAKRATDGRRDAVVLADVDGPRPVPAIVRAERALALAGELLAAGERRLRALMSGLDAEALGPADWAAVDPEGEWRRDVDLPGDLPRVRP